jgi:hypothetical protein
MDEVWIVIAIAAVFGFVVGFLGKDQRSEEEMAAPLALAAEERAALRGLRERQVTPLRDFLALCSERVAAVAERDYRLTLYEQSPGLRSAVSRDAYYAQVTHAIHDKAFWGQVMHAFFRASAAAPNPRIRELLRSVWQETLATDTPGAEAQQALERANRAIEDYVVRS